jgi:hypothetical protein
MYQAMALQLVGGVLMLTETLLDTRQSFLSNKALLSV